MMRFGWARLLAAAAATFIWLGWTLTDEGARDALAKFRRGRHAQ